MPHLTKTSSATRQGPPKCSLRQGRYNLAVVLRQRTGQWVVAPLIFDGGVAARHQQDLDDGDVPVSAAILIGPACRCSTFWCRRHARAARAPPQRTLESSPGKEVPRHHSSLLCPPPRHPDHQRLQAAEVAQLPPVRRPLLARGVTSLPRRPSRQPPNTNGQPVAPRRTAHEATSSG